MQHHCTRLVLGSRGVAAGFPPSSPGRRVPTTPSKYCIPATYPYSLSLPLSSPSLEANRTASFIFG